MLRFVVSLAGPDAKAEGGAVLRRFSGYLDRVSIEEMKRAIEENCERVGAGEW
ncbi:MAG TPA: hypothetical protein VKU01_25330 [Bryobacteraceae bacterium]|nr:hypothetical protein [Bryobacteraceae bacterium]